MPVTCEVKRSRVIVCWQDESTFTNQGYIDSDICRIVSSAIQTLCKTYSCQQLWRHFTYRRGLGVTLIITIVMSDSASVN